MPQYLTFHSEEEEEASCCTLLQKQPPKRAKDVISKHNCSRQFVANLQRISERPPSTHGTSECLLLLLTIDITHRTHPLSSKTSMNIPESKQTPKNTEPPIPQIRPCIP
eukprot:4237240-Amphidinium_carterae.1